MNAKLTRDTEADLLRGIEWFDKISHGLGDQFESEFPHWKRPASNLQADFATSPLAEPLGEGINPM